MKMIAGAAALACCEEVAHARWRRRRRSSRRTPSADTRRTARRPRRRRRARAASCRCPAGRRAARRAGSCRRAGGTCRGCAGSRRSRRAPPRPRRCRPRRRTSRAGLGALVALGARAAERRSARRARRRSPPPAQEDEQCDDQDRRAEAEQDLRARAPFVGRLRVDHDALRLEQRLEPFAGDEGRLVVSKRVEDRLPSCPLAGYVTLPLNSPSMASLVVTRLHVARLELLQELRRVGDARCALASGNVEASS